MLFVFNNEEQQKFLTATFPAEDLFLDTRYENIRGAEEFIQKRFCEITNAQYKGDTFTPVLANSCYRMDVVSENRGVISNLNPTKLEHGTIDRDGCSVSVCHDGILDKFCDQTCSDTCTAKNGLFDPTTCTWTCSCDMVECPEVCPIGMKLRTGAASADDCCGYDISSDCVCDDKPTCQAGQISEMGPNGCFGPCQDVGVCPAFDRADCTGRGGAVQKVGPCSYCNMCPAVAEELPFNPPVTTKDTTPAEKAPANNQPANSPIAEESSRQSDYPGPDYPGSDYSSGYQF